MDRAHRCARRLESGDGREHRVRHDGYREAPRLREHGDGREPRLRVGRPVPAPLVGGSRRQALRPRPSTAGSSSPRPTTAASGPSTPAGSRGAREHHAVRTPRASGRQPSARSCRHRRSWATRCSSARPTRTCTRSTPGAFAGAPTPCAYRCGARRPAARSGRRLRSATEWSSWARTTAACRRSTRPEPTVATTGSARRARSGATGGPVRSSPAVVGGTRLHRFRRRPPVRVRRRRCRELFRDATCSFTPLVGRYRRGDGRSAGDRRRARGRRFRRREPAGVRRGGRDGVHRHPPHLRTALAGADGRCGPRLPAIAGHVVYAAATGGQLAAYDLAGSRELQRGAASLHPALGDATLARGLGTGNQPWTRPDRRGRPPRLPSRGERRLG